MTTTPTLRDAALKPCPFCKGSAHIKAVARDWWKLVIDHADECMLSGHFDDAIVPQDDEHKAWLADRWNTRAALAAPADALAEPVGYLEWFDGKPVWGEGCVCSDPVWPTAPGDGDESTSMPIYTATQLQQAVARALEPIRQAIRDYHYALDTRQHGGNAERNAFAAIRGHLGMHWKQGEEAAIRQQGKP